MGIDTVDLYYAHKDDLDTPLEETLRAVGELIEQGKIRHAAASNYSAERLQEAVRIGAREGMAAYMALQPRLQPVGAAQTTRVSSRAYASARGLPASPTSALLGAFSAASTGAAVRRSTARALPGHDAPVAAVALAWLLAQPTVLAPIVSATSPKQLAELLACAQLELSAGELRRLSSTTSWR